MNENEARTVVDDLLSQYGQLTWQTAPLIDKHSDLSALFRRKNSIQRVVLECAPNGSPKTINEYAGRLGMKSKNNELNILVAPFLGDRGRAICEKGGISCVDLSGNAYIRTADLLIDRQGRENRHKVVRTQRNLFSRKSSWIVRALLTSPDKGWTTKELSEASKVSLAQVFKVTEALEEEGYLSKERANLHLTDAPGLLDDWTRAYHQERVVIGYYSPYKERGEVFARLRRCQECDYALTLGAAASLIAPVVRSTDVYMYSKDADALKTVLELAPVEFGGNIYLLEPRDEGVLRGMRTVEGLRLVSDLQLYLDLYNYPQRGREQAEEIRTRVLRL